MKLTRIAVRTIGVAPQARSTHPAPGTHRPRTPWARLAGILLLWWAWTPVLYGLGWCLRLVTPGHRFAQSADQWFYVNYLVLGGWFWLWLTIGLIGSAVIALIVLAGPGRASRQVVPAIAAILAMAAFVQLWRVAWDDDKDFARYYDRSTVFYTPSLSSDTAPPSLARLLTGGKVTASGGSFGQGKGGQCDLQGRADVPGCVRIGTLPQTGWDARVSSYNGAVFAMSRTSGDMQNVSLNADTVTYLNASPGHLARWSGILDGTGISQGMGGVSEWDGAQVTTCRFTGKWAIDRSFGGTNMADMPDYLAQQYPGLRWNIHDVWGYCAGPEPVVVIPVTKIIRWMDRTVSTAAGIIIVTGDNGKTHLAYQPDVKPGELPGKVYPKTLVDTQLTEVSWAAGRGSMNNGGFGYVPTSSAAQQGHTANYLLRDTATGRLELVTPLTLRNSSSQLFVAYAVTLADSVTAGQLNQLSIYVLGPGDPRQINVDNMEAEARNWLASQQPGFISSGGSLLEFTPVGGDMWRAYGELNGRVVYLLDIDATGKVAPALTSVSPIGPSTPGGAAGAASTAVCGKPLASLSTAQLAFCLRQFADQLSQREGQPAP
jgi:hypothetical protein